MNKTMLDYSKIILEKVSFDSVLFEKELKKCIRLITYKEEVKELKRWCMSRFNQDYGDIVDKCFESIGIQNLPAAIL